MDWAGFDFQNEVDSFLALPDVAEERRCLEETKPGSVLPGQVVFNPYFPKYLEDGGVEYVRAPTVGVVVRTMMEAAPMVTIMSDYVDGNVGPHWALPVALVESEVTDIEHLYKQLDKEEEIKKYFLMGHLTKKNMVVGREATGRHS